MHPHEQLIDRFYRAFQARDAQAMGACYHPEVEFWDPVFRDLRGAEPGAMWAMLCARATDLALSHDGVRADDREGAARWEARYTFAATGRKVLNRIEARFLFRDGCIVRHIDRFSFWRWARQALGPAGLVLGWTPLLRRKVTATARAGLTAWMAKGASGAQPPR